MKSHCFTILAACAVTITSAQAATYSFRNGNSLSSAASGIQDSLGRTFRASTTAGEAFSSGGGVSAGSGVVAFGFFSVPDANLSSLGGGALLASFQMFGTSSSFTTSGPVGNRSIFTSTMSVPVTGSAFDNQLIYLFSGNGSTLANSTEFLVVRSESYFTASGDSFPTPTSIIFTPANSTVVIGQVVANVQTANSDNSISPGWQMGVPEPSVAIMLPLAALVCLRRRRQDF